jgi:hypothetical protein
VSQQLDEQASVVLDASGYGQVTLQPDSWQTWTVTAINVRTDQAVTATPVPQATVYLGDAAPGQIVAQTWMGNRASAGGSPLVVQPSQRLIVEWTNGVPASRATVSLYGVFDMRR